MTNEIGMLKPTPPVVMREGPAQVARKDPGMVAKTEKATDVPAEEQAKEPSDIDDVVSGLNSLVHELHRELEFSVDRDSGDTVIKVIDRTTDKVVRQIPPEEVLRLRKRLLEAAGVIFQDSA